MPKSAAVSSKLSFFVRSTDEFAEYFLACFASSKPSASTKSCFALQTRLIPQLHSLSRTFAERLLHFKLNSSAIAINFDYVDFGLTSGSRSCRSL